MKIVVLKGRGALVNYPEELAKRCADATIVDMDDCQSITVLDIRHSVKCCAGKAARDWLVRGRGFSKFSQVVSHKSSLQTAQEFVSKFGAKEIQREYARGLEQPKKAKVKMVAGIFDSLSGYRNLK